MTTTTTPPKLSLADAPTHHFTEFLCPDSLCPTPSAPILSAPTPSALMISFFLNNYNDDNSNNKNSSKNNNTSSLVFPLQLAFSHQSLGQDALTLPLGWVNCALDWTVALIMH